MNAALAGFTPVNNAVFAGRIVEVRCTSTMRTERASPAGTIVTYCLIVIASSEIYGSLDYVQRRLRTSVSLDPLKSSW